MLKMKYIKPVVFILAIGMCSILCAAEESVKNNVKDSEPKTKGLEIVPETASAVVNKATALLTGDLDYRMAPGKDKYKDDYDLDPQGRHIPRRTLKKYDSGVR